jgi:hypothetical protein
MFGLTVSKLLFTVLIAVLLWVAFRKLNALLAHRDAGEVPGRASRRPQPRHAGAAVDLAPCPRCGTYIARGSTCEACQGR